MSREMVMLITCNSCGTTGRGAPPRWNEVTVTVNTDVHQLDMCQECAENHDGPLASLIRIGSPVARSKARKAKAEKTGKEALLDTVTPVPSVVTAEGQHQCPDCLKGYTSAPGLNQHRSRKHGYVTPHAAGKADLGNGPLTCKVRGCGFGAKMPQGLAAHMRVKHPKQFAAMQRAKQSA